MASISRLYHNNNGKKTYLSSWLLQKVIRLIISFVMCFFIVIILRRIFSVLDLTNKEIISEFIKLKIPECSTWYLKIQILMYFLVSVSFAFVVKYKILFKIDKLELTGLQVMTFVLLSFTFVYYFIAVHLLEFPNYWWKTSLCFPAGAIMYTNRDKIRKIYDSTKNKIMALCSAIIVFIVSYVYVWKAATFSVLHMFAYTGIATGVCIVFDTLKTNSKTFAFVSTFSLELYLIHIGNMSLFNWTVPSAFNQWSVIIRITIFIICSVISAFVANKIVTYIREKNRVFSK